MHAHSLPSKLALASLLLTTLTPFVAAQSSSDDLESSLDNVFSSAFPSTTDGDTATGTDTAAGQTITGDISITNGVECPGVLYGGNDGGYCCIGGSLTLSTCPGWPICTGSGTVDTATQTQSCVTKVPVTQSDYSAVISSYSQGLLSGSSGASGESGATATSGSDGASGTNAAASGSQEPGSSSSDSSGGRVGPMGVVAGGLLGLAAML